MREMLLAAMCLLSGPAAWGGIVLTGDTSRPDISTFIPGETVTLTFTATGMTEADKDLRLLINIADEHGKTVEPREIPIKPDDSGSWTASFAAPNSKLGFYRVNAKLSNGVQLEKLGSRHEGYLTYCVVPDPKLRQLYDRKDTRFGMSGGFSPKVPIQPYLGIRWMYGGYTWRNEEPDRPGQFAEKRAAAKAAGEKPMNRNIGSWRIYTVAAPFFVPDWAAIPETKAGVSGALTPAGEKAWDDYCRQLAEATVEEDPDGDEHIYQITWEPVSPWGFKGTDEQLIRIYQIAYPALHQYDPKALVIGPTGAGISDDNTKWDARILKAGLGKYIDAYCIHPYHAIPPEPEKMVQHTRQLQAIVRRGIGRDVPIFGTEQGNATKEDPAKELDQARGLLRENLIVLGEGFRFNMAFYIADYPTEPGFGYYYNLNPKIPHGTDKISPKPIVPAYAAQSFLIEGHKSAGAIEWLGETTLGYAFVRKDDVVLALWDYGDKPRRVRVPVGAKQVDVYDWMGNKKVVASPNGILGLTLTPEPTYVKGVSSRLWGTAARKPIKLQSTRVPVFPGGKAVIRASVDTAGRPIRGSLVIDPDVRLDIPKIERQIDKTGKSLTFDLAIPAACKPGKYPVMATLRDKIGPIGVTGLVLTVNPVVEILSAVPIIGANGARAVRITLRESAGRRAAGAVKVEIKGMTDSRRSAAFTLTPKGLTTLVVPCDCPHIRPANPYKLTVTVSAPRITGCTRQFRIDFLEAQRLRKTPTIDGNLADWNGIRVIALEGPGMVVRSPEYFTGHDDLAAAVRFAWDESALYLAAEVTDDVFLQRQTGFMTWQEDCIQVGVDLDPDKAGKSSGNLFAEAGSRRHSEIDLALTTNGPEAYRTITFDAASHPVQLLTTKQCRLAVVKGSGKLIYEAAIPWETLGARTPMKPHDRIGIALAVNDLDDPTQRDPTALGLYGGIAWNKDPDKFGILTLGE